MKTNKRKINYYSAIHISSVFIIVGLLILATFTFPFGMRTSADPLPNNPPYIPSNPGPDNNSTDISILTNLNWTGGDPDNDTVTYDVFFGTNSTPLIVTSNQSNLTYNPGTLSYSSDYYWKIIAWDEFNASTIGPLWKFTTEPKPNTPPNTPSNPNPANGAVNVLLGATLSWIGGDPDVGDSVSYDVYFGEAPTPSKVSGNQTSTSYDPPGKLKTNTKYYWKIVAWDDLDASTTGLTWSFTTKSLPTVIITVPNEKTLYIQDKPYLEEKFPVTFIYGSINITATASSGIGIKRVEFYVDNISIGNGNRIGTSNNYSISWNPTDIEDELKIKHTIKAVVIDNEDDSTSSTPIEVIKWRFHPLPLYIGGAAIGALLLSKLLLHTTVRGLFFDVQQSMFSTSFYAVRIHFSTTGPFKHVRGVVNFRSCTGGILIGPIKMIRFGPLHNIVYGSFTFLGDIHYMGSNFGQGNLINLLRNAAS